MIDPDWMDDAMNWADRDDGSPAPATRPGGDSLHTEQPIQFKITHTY